MKGSVSMEHQHILPSSASKTESSREKLEQYLRARAWKDNAFRQEFQTNPKAVLERDYAHYFPDGKIPSELFIKVIEEDEQTIYFVLPFHFSDDQSLDLDIINDEEFLGISGGYPIRSNGTGCPFCTGKSVVRRLETIAGSLRL
jgi:hypothetical protein